MDANQRNRVIFSGDYPDAKTEENLNAIRCPNCNQLLFKASGFGATIEIKCPKCNSMVRWPSLAPEIIPAIRRKHVTE